MLGKIEGGRRGWQRMRWLDGSTRSEEHTSELQSPALQADSATMNSSNLHMNLKNKSWTSAKKAAGIWAGITLNSKINLGSIVLFNNIVSWSMSMRFYLFQFSSVAQSCLTPCDSMDCGTPGLPAHHQLPELAQTHVHQVGDAIQPPHPLSSPSPAFNLSQHQGLF